MPRDPRPSFFPGDQLRPGAHLERAAFAVARHLASRNTDIPEASHASPAALARAIWPEDKATLALLTRGAVSPASTGNAGWASVIAGAAVLDFVESLAPLSAAARLVAQAALRPSLAGFGLLLIPGRQGLPSPDMAWVAEGGTIPARRFALSTVQLGPTSKLAAICALTRELLESANGEEVLSALLREDAAAALDAGLFSASAATAVRPAGLLSGVAPIAAAAGGGTEAMLTDLEKLAGALAVAGGSGDVVYVMAPLQAASARLRLGNERPATVYATPALAAGTVMAIDPRAFAAGFDPEPHISAGREASVVLDDASPAAIGTAGTPNVAGAPARSAWQTDTVLLKVVLDVAYVMRAPGLVAVINNVTWG